MRAVVSPAGRARPVGGVFVQGGWLVILIEQLTPLCSTVLQYEPSHDDPRT